MLIVHPDFDRRIDLPGAGHCPRPIDLDRHRAPLDRLVSLRVYSFAQGIAIGGEAEGDEVFIVLMRGAADFAISRDGEALGAFALREADGNRALYMPPHTRYRLSAVADCDIAYARCTPVRADLPPVRGFAAAGSATGMEFTLTPIAMDASIATAEKSERFVHVRASAGAIARLGDQQLGDWDAAILAEGDAATIAAEGGAIDVLVVTATAG